MNYFLFDWAENAEQERKIKIQSSDGQVFEVERQIANRLGLIRALVEELLDDEFLDVSIPIPNVHSDILDLVLQWSEHHKDDAVDEYRELSDWDRQFLRSQDQSTLLDILTAANYMDAADLLKAGIKALAEMVKGKSPDELRLLFNIVNDID